ncbi:hypothetical protein DIREPILLOW8_209 [Vibrio phage Direpillow8]|uniref:Uncharacterized protein n=2 Tax=Thalassavirus TaxID=2948922 RepID=A0A6G8R4U9_9CAUD|nr:hypothetical protein KNU58_gp091 [Vibrio phage Brizo]YP_010105788.1 hypothetical protein KNU88_gp002 [Vibrio phage Chester]YP_010105965.1 hypothetical protein KNU88_gp107 [Vibrio phage Chester]QIG66123.1 hypothetical protein CILSICK_2 [Vibrio phage Cilsick]QKE60864.1 hypothetical protein DAX_3 [Vibrio phage Dax]QKN84469.1 hypothetical protein BBMUFFIN_3 [Vibrio phage BBMuffin]QKN85442.1 hypothetical protein DIREPILLOW8_3 [Vibrio phage Direpillow8]WBU76809.1 hypothetical protein KRONOS_3 [
MLRPSEMLVSFLQHLQESGFSPLYYKNELVESIEQIEYDKFVIRMAYASDDEIRCDGIFISEFLDIVKDFTVK